MLLSFMREAATCPIELYGNYRISEGRGHNFSSIYAECRVMFSFAKITNRVYPQVETIHAHTNVLF